MSDYPGFGGGFLTEFTWVLEKMGRDFDVAMNPGLDVGFDMEPQTVNELVDVSASKPAINRDYSLPSTSKRRDRRLPC